MTEQPSENEHLGADFSQVRIPPEFLAMMEAVPEVAEVLDSIFDMQQAAMMAMIDQYEAVEKTLPPMHPVTASLLNHPSMAGPLHYIQIQAVVRAFSAYTGALSVLRSQLPK